MTEPAARGLRLDIDAVTRAVTSKTEAIFFATPSNPSGVVISQEELKFIAELAISQDLWVVADEVYVNLTFERPHVSIASLPGIGRADGHDQLPAPRYVGGSEGAKHAKIPRCTRTDFRTYF